MIRLLLSDLRHHAGSWAWTAVVAVVAASAVAGQFRVAHGAFAAAEAAGDPTMIDGAESVSGIIIIGVVFAAVAVLSSTSNLVVSQRERDHGLWKALGMSPSMVRLVIRGAVEPAHQPVHDAPAHLRRGRPARRGASVETR